MNQLVPVPVPDDEAQEIMRNDIVTLLDFDLLCPLARAIEAALHLLDVVVEVHSPEAE